VQDKNINYLIITPERIWHTISKVCIKPIQGCLKTISKLHAEI